MKVLICGSRNFTDKAFIYKELDTYETGTYEGISEVIHGGAKGVDTIAGEWAIERGLPVHVYPANWNKYGKGAGPIRNEEMLEKGKPGWIIAFLAKGSKGTANMIELATRAGIETKIIDI